MRADHPHRINGIINKPKLHAEVKRLICLKIRPKQDGTFWFGDNAISFIIYCDSKWNLVLPPSIRNWILTAYSDLSSATGITRNVFVGDIHMYSKKDWWCELKNGQHYHSGIRHRSHLMTSFLIVGVRQRLPEIITICDHFTTIFVQECSNNQKLVLPLGESLFEYFQCQSIPGGLRLINWNHSRGNFLI